MPGGHRLHPVAELPALGWLPTAHMTHASWAAIEYVPLAHAVHAWLRTPLVAVPAEHLCVPDTRHTAWRLCGTTKCQPVDGGGGGGGGTREANTHT